ncbi:radical SAM superfamily-domain-containing protein [Neohortaea acidophila]|uniref:tRNA 4-demethylwyosine synthase (AdoMet-dependent) n=1 Tax=Neohortaea acidophila TaxID=245834 RepID=A0A6A6PSP3_9PEZI|nr:radical SAM superfamily-domain-containing protein [Neohortaea acidophila]KAF2483120.1 radical SAM superfamily-domain-containing protein [Neohortaea acidophila]
MLALPSELLLLWHEHRIELLLSAGFFLACVRVAIHRRQRPAKPELSSPSPLVVDIKAPQTVKDVLEKPVEPSPRLSTTSAALKPSSGPRRVKGVRKTKASSPEGRQSAAFDTIEPHIFYFSLSGSTKSFAQHLHQSLLQSSDDLLLPAVLHDLTDIDYDDFFIAPPKTPHPRAAPFYLLLLPTYDISTELDNFLSNLQETHHDFRIDTHPLSGLAGYSVFGFGDKHEWPSEDAGFCTQAVQVDKWMARLTGGKRAFPLGTADVKSGAETSFEEWSVGLNTAFTDVAAAKGLGLGVEGSGDAVESGSEDDDDDAGIKPPRTGDLEDLKAPVPIDFTTAKAIVKPMVPTTSPTYAALTKQGYTIVGTHSGVKICRWTKSALRGRGSCYKYSFYGIQSHLCMEATPSLSCSNKCVFCWRHGTNPVSTTWKWTVDPPDEIFVGLKEGHYKKIKMMKGVPGVRAERFQEAMTIRHCALSLVGEPIFYPHINELLAMLHKEHVSTFLVCNAQHPDQLAALGPVTQLYVSIDASNKESLKKIDRPLHRDFWERFLRCMDILREKRFTHRTVFRLTLVKGFNIEEEAEGYADLVQRALPSFVEVKGVTYCGTSTAAGAGLTMRNVPFYEEVSAFVLALEAALLKRGLQYGIAAEHAHSCCILLADKTRFFRSDETDTTERWHTLIDYPKFFKCLESGEQFRPEDYVGAATPEWALWGNGGFDPRDERVDRKGRKIEESKE